MNQEASGRGRDGKMKRKGDKRRLGEGEEERRNRVREKRKRVEGQEGEERGKGREWNR